MTPERLKELTEWVNDNTNYLKRENAAISRDLPLELQEILVRDKDWQVRWNLACNPSLTDVKIQEILARDEDSDVRYYLAINPNFTDRKLWELLRNDENKWVREKTNQRIEKEKERIKAEFKEKINK